MHKSLHYSLTVLSRVASELHDAAEAGDVSRLSGILHPVKDEDFDPSHEVPVIAGILTYKGGFSHRIKTVAMTTTRSTWIRKTSMTAPRYILRSSTSTSIRMGVPTWQPSFHKDPSCGSIVSGSLDCMRLLLEAGAEIMIRCEGSPALHIAVSVGTLPAFKDFSVEVRLFPLRVPLKRFPLVLTPLGRTFGFLRSI
eukprot:5681722-Pyramimonas_sp.AAC.2